MRNLVVGGLVGAGFILLGMWLASDRSQVLAQQLPYAAPGGQAAASELLALSTTVAQHHQQLSVVDPRARVLSVYHIDLNTGEISLKSVRQLHWDLQMIEFNGVEPLPGSIRTILEHR